MISLEDARRVVSAAEEKAQEIGQPMDIAVLDAGRNLKSFARTDGAWLGSIEIAIATPTLRRLSRCPRKIWPRRRSRGSRSSA